MNHSHAIFPIRPLNYQLQRCLCASMILAALCAVTLPSAHAVDFEFDMGRDSTMNVVNDFNDVFPMVCGSGRSQVNQEACDGDDVNNADNGNQPWINEMVSDDLGNRYFHMVIGLPGEGFTQEVYILASQNNFSWDDGDPDAPSDSGGHLGFGDGLNPDLGNGSDPLGKLNNNTFTGAGTGNPVRVLMKQVLQSDASANPNTNGSKGVFYQEFNKTAFNYIGTDINALKPKIIQTLSLVDENRGDLDMVFIADMSAISYSDDGSPLTVSNDTGASGVLVNTLTLSGTAAVGNFDMSTDSEAGNAAPTAGRYTFTAGTGFASDSGWVNPSTYDRGTYTYFDDSFDQFAVEYASFCDVSQIKDYGVGADNNGC
ncbi:MAG: hypothetical protein COB33_001165 [Thiotrichaceae bacterium]|nr:hypothetical protein [Thiotrichaceae bacterium]